MTDGSRGAGTPQAVGMSEEALKAKLEVIQNTLDHKPGTFHVLGLMAAVVALPVGLLAAWFPSKMSDVEAAVERAATASESADKNSQAALAETQGVAARIDSLVIAIARGEARLDSPAKLMALSRLLPTDVYTSLVQSGKVAGFRHAEFDDKHWFFIDQAGYNQLSSAEQGAVEASFGRYNARLVIEE